MSLDTTKQIKSITYNGTEIPLVGGSSSSGGTETTFTFSIPDQYIVYSSIGSNRTNYEVYEKGTHNITVLLNSSIIMIDAEGNTPYGVGTNCNLTSIYSFGGIPSQTCILVDITGANAVLDLT